MRWAGWAKSREPPSEGAPEFQAKGARDKVTKRRRGKERVEWGRGPWRAVLAFLPRGFQVPSYATGLFNTFVWDGPPKPVTTKFGAKNP